MSSHRRVKDIAYDEDELYSDEDEYGQGEEYTAEDKQNFATITPVVRAGLQEAGLQASDRQIEDALWHYYWDVAKSVTYLSQQQSTSKTTQQTKQTPKAKSKFDQAFEKSGSQAKGLSLPPGPKWFEGVPWTLSNDSAGDLVPANNRPAPKLLGGSSKLAKLAEERRKKAAQQNETASPLGNTLSALDKLALDPSKKRSATEAPSTAQATRKYPVKKKREATPPPEEPEPMDVEPAKPELPDIRAQPSAFGATLAGKSKARDTVKMSIDQLLGAAPADDAFKGPSPDDVATRAQAQSKVPIQTKTPAKTVEDDTVKQKPAGPLPDAIKLWQQQRKTQRPFAAFVVAGHVDHGKSTMMGRLLLDSGAVQQRDIDKFKKQAAEIGKESFALAWVMDTGAEERERGVTVEIAQHFFSTETADFSILDAPGHRDFVPNMIGGAMMADIVVLVVDANQLESGLKGQTREHILLAYGVGIRKVVVAINKLDASNPPWSKDLFSTVKDKIGQLLGDIGFPQSSTVFVPCSGLSGENVVKPVPANSAANALCSKSPSLIRALQSLAYDDKTEKGDDPTKTTPQDASLHEPFRLQVADVYRGGVQNPLSISGRVLGGSVVVGQKVVIEPSAEQATIKGIQVAEEPREYAAAFEIASLHLDGDLETLNRNLRVGDLITSTTKRITSVTAVSLRVAVLDTILPQTVEVHFGRIHEAGSVRRLVATLGAAGEVLKKNPRSLKNGQTAVIEVAFKIAVPIEKGNRLVLRADGATIAFGTVEGVFSQ